MAPTTRSADINIVITKFMARIIFTEKKKKYNISS